MNSRERFINVLSFKKPEDRLPMVEWASWWNKTRERWTMEGMPQNLTLEESWDYFGLDHLVLIAARGLSDQCPKPDRHGGKLITDEESYDKLKVCLYSDSTIEKLKQSATKLKERHEKGDIIIRLWLDGFFWFPRKLFGIEGHMYAFYDYPELMHRINKDLADFNIRVIEELFPILQPDMVGFAEDMSYNLGPMLSYELFSEFLAPYYQKVIPYIKKHGVKILVDSDGDIYSMIPWLIEAGIDGVYPLERQAGVDICKIRREYPGFLMMGGFDKMVMSRGEKAMREEFERIYPVMKSGGYIPSVDHQTPPDVSIENYRIYAKLFKEFCEKAVKDA